MTCSLSKEIFFVTLLFSILSLAQTSAVLKKGHDFFSWLEKNESVFTNCKIEKINDFVELCDRTKISYSEIKKLFESSPSEVLSFVQSKKIQVNIICNSEKQTDFLNTSCLKESLNKTFESVPSFHGLYVTESNTIYIRSSATKGTLIHEYLHFLQSKNSNAVNGRVYKTEKNDLKNSINKELDRIELEIKQAEKRKQTTILKEKFAEFMKVNELMLSFSKWQDLIDERSIFLFFIQFEKDFKIPKTDIELATKNLNYICNRKDYKSPLLDCKNP